MEIVKYSDVLYYKPMLTWLKEREAYIPFEDEVPQVGYVALDNNREPVAMGFLRRCEGRIALIDSLVTAPERSSEERHIAINLIVEHLILTAKIMGLRNLVAYSVDEGVLKRAPSYGFHELAHKVLSLQLHI